ncbi:MAG: 2-oxoacid:acceptor oxidoreductase family protein, partial [Coriobacteriales bacterium]|nr:2-oxoacid:acceptor oxidoreductase family protein [Coriobacteriales bacterium]
DYDPQLSSEPEGTIMCKFWGLGSDGTVGANKTAIKIIGDYTDLNAQGYFAYDSKKSGGVTISHLRFGVEPIKSPYYITRADYVACHNQAYVNQYDLVHDLKDDGVFLLNTVWTPAELDEKLPASLKRALAVKKARFYVMDAYKIAHDLGLGNRINMVMQAAFFALTEVIPVADAARYLKEGINKAYGKKGQKILDMNYAAVDAGLTAFAQVEIPASWAQATDPEGAPSMAPAFIEDILVPINRQEGDTLPVSAFLGREDGHFPSGTSAFEKRGVALNVPVWDATNCTQCNQCAFVCPHAAIRPVLVTDEELTAAPATFTAVKARGKGFEGLSYRMQVSPLDCMGCGNCADICLARAKDPQPLKMTAEGWDSAEEAHWTFAMTLPVRDGLTSKTNIKGSQFAKPYLEFSGACAGCGETPYIKVITQLFGDHMLIANATGCSSIWGASAPSMPYCTDDQGHGPAWANSLFEDNAEYALGMAVANRQMRARLVDAATTLAGSADGAGGADGAGSADGAGGVGEARGEAVEAAIEAARVAAEAWLDGRDDASVSRAVSATLLDAARTLLSLTPIDDRARAAQVIVDCADYLSKKSIWALGGDGWAYDIGYGGLDHVLASGENINVLVFDTEVYSNTGGQASKATPLAAIAKFAASGKRIKKKDLGMMAMSYGYVYVAQVGMGADKNQFLKAVLEAEAYDGPSLIIAYAPCINHGLKAGMGKTQENTANAVASGYWQLYRYNPALVGEVAGDGAGGSEGAGTGSGSGVNPFRLDSREPTKSFRDFIMDQNRYASLATEFPDIAEELFVGAERNAAERLASYKRLAAAE